VVGTGDEVVAIDQKVEPYQIRQSNAYAIAAALKLSGYDKVTCFHLRDDKDELRANLSEMLKDFDVLVLSGGVSMGKFDYIPDVLADIGVKVVFHQVKQRPGKPFWFGNNKEGKPVFALPGNPVSTQVGLYRYVLPYLNKAVNAYALEQEFVVLDRNVDVKTDRTYFLPVKIKGQEDGRLLATPVFPRVSGDYAALAKSDGFIELLEGIFEFPMGAAARLYRWKI
jgi:molybdopterin molybdotransferase